MCSTFTHVHVMQEIPQLVSAALVFLSEHDLAIVRLHKCVSNPPTA